MVNSATERAYAVPSNADAGALGNDANIARSGADAARGAGIRTRGGNEKQGRREERWEKGS